MSEPDDEVVFCEDIEVEIYQAILEREESPGGLPDRQAFDAMEEPVSRLLGAAFLFQDLSIAIGDAGVRARGLDFLAGAIHREAERLFRLYHGRRPDGD